MPDFADFLDAKFDLDERSLAPDVRRECIAALEHRDTLRCLDVGTGTGATVRRLLAAGLRATSLEIVALDRDPSLVARARARLTDDLAQHGFAVRVDPRIDPRDDLRVDDPDTPEAATECTLSVHDGRRRILLRFACRDVAKFEPHAGERYDLITAHAFMDLVPMRPLLERFADWLAPGGVFYATLNYDGETALFPPWADDAFEARLFERYDASMEQRRIDGKPTGGAHSGRRLHTMLIQAGFEMLAYASSDWNVVPRRGRLRDGDDIVLSVLLDALRRENDGRCDGETLAAWYRDRRALLETGRLGAIVHQIDVLAAAPPVASERTGSDCATGLTAFT